MSAFHLDLAVVDSVNPQRYVLGIICDGDGYYHLKTVRDREMVQPSVLKTLGWKLMRVWSADWFIHPDMVVQSIVDRLQEI